MDILIFQRFNFITTDHSLFAYLKCTLYIYISSEVQFNDVHGDKPPSLMDLPIDANISTNKPTVPVRTSPLWNEMMPQFNPFNLMNPMNVMDSSMFMGQVSTSLIYFDFNNKCLHCSSMASWVVC